MESDTAKGETPVYSCSAFAYIHTYTSSIQLSPRKVIDFKDIRRSSAFRKGVFCSQTSLDSVVDTEHRKTKKGPKVRMRRFNTSKPSALESPPSHSTKASALGAAIRPRRRNEEPSLELEKLSDLGGYREMSPPEVLFFERNGHFLDRGLFSNKEISDYAPHLLRAFRRREAEAISQKVFVLTGRKEKSLQAYRKVLSLIDPNSIPFLQVFNLWRSDPFARRIAFSRRLGSVAAQLLGVDRLRLYQDSLFIKRPGDGNTGWHSDLNMTPLDTNRLVTAWIPLQDVPDQEEGGTGLVFASASHLDFALPHWYDSHGGGDFSSRYEVETYGALNKGDVTFHHGWCLHFAPSNTTASTRAAYTVSFVADGVRRLSKKAKHKPDPEDEMSYSGWLDSVRPGAKVEHDDIPLVYDGTNT